MTQESQDAIAARLRSARLAQGLDVAVLGRELKLPQAVLEAMERGDWTRLGAPVYARALVGRYAARLGVPVDVAAVVQQVRGPELRSHVPQSRLGRFADFSARQAAYAGGTLLVLPLLYMLVTQLPDAGRLGQRALDPVASSPADGPAPGAAAIGVTSSPIPAAAPVPSSVPAVAPPGAADPVLPDADARTAATTSDTATPVVAAPGAPMVLPSPVAAGLTPSMPSSAGALRMSFSADSWIEVYGRDGGVLEKALARAGESREWPVAEVARVTIGNVDGTTVAVDGSSVNLDPVRAANVARFALSSDGAIEAVAR